MITLLHMWQTCGVRIYTTNAVLSSMTLNQKMYLRIPIKREIIPTVSQEFFSFYKET